MSAVCSGEKNVNMAIITNRKEKDKQKGYARGKSYRNSRP